MRFAVFHNALGNNTLHNRQQTCGNLGETMPQNEPTDKYTLIYIKHHKIPGPVLIFRYKSVSLCLNYLKLQESINSKQIHLQT